MMEQKAQNGLPIYQVDAFTDLPFRGNPAAVCLLQKPLHEEIMQNIAQEMNLSETAFVVPLDQSSPLETSVFSLRWFTPQVEVPLCGHATLAASAVLFHEMGHPGPVLHFETRSGQLTAQKEQEGILLNFPAEKPQSVALPLAVLQALGNPKAVRSAYAQGKQMLLIELENEEELRSLKPDFELLKQADVKVDTREGLMITSIAQPPYDFVSRFFAPWIGINEDPVTGSALTVLAPYWGEILGKQNMLAYQASPRGGEIKLQIINPQRVNLLGRAVIVLKGTLQW